MTDVAQLMLYHSKPNKFVKVPYYSKQNSPPSKDINRLQMVQVRTNDE
jgi:hypothetical protein